MQSVFEISVKFFQLSSKFAV